MAETPGLVISTLGGLSIQHCDELVTDLASRKVEAWLVYLACNPRAHRREALAELFWEERTQVQAMSLLRVALSSLRKQVGDCVEITRETVAVKPEAGVPLDVAEMEEQLRAGEIEQAVEGD